MNKLLDKRFEKLKTISVKGREVFLPFDEEG